MKKQKSKKSKQSELLLGLQKTIISQQQTIEDNKKGIATLIDKYEDQFEEYEKANEELKKQNTQLTLNVEELKERLFGKITMRLKNFTMRPDKKKDN